MQVQRFALVFLPERVQSGFRAVFLPERMQSEFVLVVVLSEARAFQVQGEYLRLPVLLPELVRAVVLSVPAL